MSAILPSLSLYPPLVRRRGQTPRLASPVVLCESCGEPLIEISVNTHFRIVCDNDRCPLFREYQGSKERPPEELAPTKKIRPKPFNLLKPSYLAWLEKRKERYRFACDLGFPCKEAMLLRGKTKRQITMLAERRVN